MRSDMPTKSAALEKFLANLDSTDLLLKLNWDEWLTIEPPYSDVKISTQDVVARYNRNGYDWDIHGTLFTPEKETNDKRAFVLFHGGAGSEKNMDLHTDGRPR